MVPGYIRELVANFTESQPQICHNPMTAKEGNPRVNVHPPYENAREAVRMRANDSVGEGVMEVTP